MSDIVRHIDLGDFETFRELRPDKAQAVKVAEETCEVYSAWEDWWYEQPGDDGGELTERLLDECADVCQAVANLVASLGVTQWEWQDAIERCHGRNEARGRYR